eukprot:GFYU01004486.1.p1 GENE.GFYU01004486.1~~GFYU01004486.1.p1  ORF type:complete len:234 (+),score=18.43 GFYU01004486.1:3-704(+)
MSESSVIVELAKSGRASCKGCKSPIAKGAIRLGRVHTLNDVAMTRWYHLSCVKKVPKGVNDGSDLDQFEDLPKESQLVVVDWLEGKNITGLDGPKELVAAKPTSKNAKGKKSKQQDSAPSLSTEEKQISEKFEGYVQDALKYTVAKLKESLRENNQAQSGAKAELATRIAECRMWGCLPLCPKCEQGRLNIKYATRWTHDGQGKVNCRGTFDDGVFQPCSYKADEVERIPWEE